MPNDPEILERLGYLYRRQGRWGEEGKFPSRAGARSADSPRRRGVNRSVITRLEESQSSIWPSWSLPPMTSD